MWSCCDQIQLHDPTLHLLNLQMLRLERAMLASLKGNLGSIDSSENSDVCLQPSVRRAPSAQEAGQSDITCSVAV